MKVMKFESLKPLIFNKPHFKKSLFMKLLKLFVDDAKRVKLS